MRSVYDDDFISGRTIAENAWLPVDAVVYRKAAGGNCCICGHPGKPGIWFWLDKEAVEISVMPPSRYVRNYIP